MKKTFTLLLALVMVTAFSVTPTFAGLEDRFSDITLKRDNYILIPEISAPSGNPASNFGWLYVKDSGGGVSNLYFESDDGTVTDLLAAGTTFDTIADPAADVTLVYQDNETAVYTFADTNEDMFNIQGIGAFGDVSVVRIEQVTGNPTDGTVLEVVAADANVDPLVVSASGKANALVVGQNTGVVTIAGVAEGTTALSLTAGDINLVDGDLNVPGGDATFGEDVTITGTLSAGTIAMDAVTAATGGATLALNGEGVGGVNIGATSTGGITLSRTTTLADTVDFTIGEGVLTVDNDVDGETAIVITSDSTTAGGAIGITSAITTAGGKAVSITADGVTAGDVLYLVSSAAGMTTGNFINAYNGAATVFEVGLYGATTIAGNAATDIVTITAGNLQMTNGDIDVDDGMIQINTTTNETSHFIRNQGTTTGPVVEIEETAAAADNAALLIDQNATAAASYGLEIDTAGGTAIFANLEAAGGDGIIFSTPAAYTGQLISVNDTLVGTTGEGLIDIKTTANLADGASLVRLDFDTGTMAGAHDGFMLSVDDDSVNVGTSYAVLINSASNEALNVASGKAIFAELATFTTGIDSNAGLDVDMATNADLVNIDNAAADIAAGAGIVTVYGSNAAGQTNASYLIRGAWKANGDAQDGFLLFEDNSTGAAANGDDMFKIDTGGAVTMAGNLTGSGASVQSGFVSTVTDVGATNPYTVTIAMCGSTFYNSQANQTNLPEASTAIGCTLTFAVMNASNFDINPDDADLIVGATNAAGDMIRSATVGDTVTLQAISASQWIVKAMYPASTDWADAD